MRRLISLVALLSAAGCSCDCMSCVHGQHCGICRDDQKGGR